MDLFVLLSFLGTAIFLTLMPGPDILFVIAQSISQNQKAGISTALGLCTGLIVHITAATLGISAIIYQSSLAFSIVKYAGAAYLLYLAWQAFKEKDGGFTFEKKEPKQYKSLYKKGILMNLLNPKVSIFFLALFPQFVVQPSPLSVPIQMVILGFIFIVQALAIFTIVSIFSEKIRDFLLKREFIAKRLNIIKGALLTFIGIQIAFSEKS